MDKMDDVNKVLTSEMQVEQNSLSFCQKCQVKTICIGNLIAVCLATPVEIR